MVDMVDISMESDHQRRCSKMASTKGKLRLNLDTVLDLAMVLDLMDMDTDMVLGMVLDMDMVMVMGMVMERDPLMRSTSHKATHYLEDLLISLALVMDIGMDMDMGMDV